MFARTAKVLTLERRHAVQAQVGQASSKIRQSDRLSAALRRRRPVLLCRWQLDPASGRPVCAWDVECPDLAPDLDIEPSWPVPEHRTGNPDGDQHRTCSNPARLGYQSRLGLVVCLGPAASRHQR